MIIAIPIFEEVTALDAVGPYEVLQRLPGAEVVFIGHEVGSIRTDGRSIRRPGGWPFSSFVQCEVGARRKLPGDSSSPTTLSGHGFVGPNWTSDFRPLAWVEWPTSRSTHLDHRKSMGHYSDWDVG